jgi:hypothetical protein
MPKIAAALLAVFLSVVVAGDALAQPASMDDSGPVPIDSQGEPVAGSVQLTFTFGSDREPMTRRQAFLLPEGMSPSAVTATVPFQDVTDQDGRPLADAHLRGVVQHTGPGRVVTLAISVDPDAPEEMRAGTYTGTALVGVGDRMTPVTLQATVQDDRLWLVIAFAAVGVIGGLFVRLFADKQSLIHINALHEVSNPRIVVTVVAGMIVGFYSIRTIYLDDPTFYAGAGDLWRVTAETFAGTLAAKTLSDLGGKQTEPAQRRFRRRAKTKTAPAEA